MPITLTCCCTCKYSKDANNRNSVPLGNNKGKCIGYAHFCVNYEFDKRFDGMLSEKAINKTYDHRVVKLMKMRLEKGMRNE